MFNLKANILVVNDRPEQLVAMETVLDDLQENIVTAQSGKEALRQVLRNEFAVILLDVHMPEMDGFETATLIRQRMSSQHTPIIFVTAYGQEDDQITRSYSLGAVDYIQTPIVPEILRAKVKVFVELYKKSKELRLIAEAEHQRELGQAQEKLEVETKRNLFFILALDLLAVAGFDGAFRQTNPAWERVLGYTSAELAGKTFPELAHPCDQASAEEQFKKLRAGTAVTYFENRVRCKDGGYKWLGWTASPFVADQLIYLFARDVTERKLTDDEIHKLNQQLRARVNEVTAVNRELETFNYSISHDLRAPLRSMQGFAQMLEADYGNLLPLPAKEFTSRIIESSRYMDQLLHDLLSYSTLSKAEIKTRPVSVEATLNEVLSYIQKEIVDKNAWIEVERPMDSVMADPSTLKQILANLISNALKFVKQGRTPHIRIYTEAFDKTVRLWVEDNGIGIEPEQQEKIFGLFHRLHTSDAFPGTGIGLAIVRKCAQRMGGNVGVESTPGIGSRFWLELVAPVEEHHEVPEKVEHLAEV